MIGVTSAADHGGPGDAGDLGVHGVGGFKDRRGAPRAAVGQEQALEHLVGAVGGEHLAGPNAVRVGQGGP